MTLMVPTEFLGGGRAGLVDFSEDVLDGVLVFPVRVVALEFADVADIPDVVADAVFFEVGEVELFACESLADADGLEHGAVRVAAAADVIDFSNAGTFIELDEGGDEVVGVDVITDLFSFIAKDAVLAAFDDALDEVGEEAVELGAGVGGAGETTAAEDACFHSKIAAVFLDEDVGGDLAGSEEGVLALVDGH